MRQLYDCPECGWNGCDCGASICGHDPTCSRHPDSLEASRELKRDARLFIAIILFWVACVVGIWWVFR